jgi:hypothetical protein
LRDFIDARFAQKSTEMSQALRIRQGASVTNPGHAHCPKLQHRERLFTQAGPILSKEDRPAHKQQ